MGKDVIGDRYGRLFQFPYQLARRGHAVTCLLTDYHLKSKYLASCEQDGVHWISVPVSSLAKLLSRASLAMREADVVIGSSDCLQICLASHLANKWEKPCILDLYDNYESFGLSRLPLVRGRYRRALRDAAAVSCVGDELNEMVRREYAPRGRVVTLNSTISAGQFYAVGREQARVRLNLPLGETLVGACGGLSSNRGIGLLYRAIQELWRDGASFKLVLAGRPEGGSPPPIDKKTVLLGNLALEQMNDFYNAMDVNVLQYLNNDFGRYCYPQKLEEVVATGAPLVAASVGELKRHFSATPSVLFDSEDVPSIKRAILGQLENPTTYNTITQSWDSVGAELEDLVLAICRSKSAARSRD